MKVNIAKSQVVHVRNHQHPLRDRDLFLDMKEMQYVSDYKYLGCWINEFLNNKKTVYALTAAAGRSYGRIVNIFKHMGDMGYSTYCTLYESYVLPVANYAAAVWGFTDYSASQVLQNKIQRFYLGVHRFAPLRALHTEMDWLRWFEMVWYFSRLATMEEDRIPKLVLRWDIQNGLSTCASEIMAICTELGLPMPIGPYRSLLIYDIEPVERIALRKAREGWQDEAHKMSKLCTYVKVKDFADPKILVQANLSRGHQSLLAKFVSGILPLEVETGRFYRIKKELRFCKICKKKKVEDKMHFVHDCKAIKKVRKESQKSFLKSSPETKQTPRPATHCHQDHHHQTAQET